jgi:lipoprotein-anchoring transpeptidase ErfK/SrfK
MRRGRAPFTNQLNFYHVLDLKRGAAFALSVGDQVKSTSMQRVMCMALLASAVGLSGAMAQSMPISPPMDVNATQMVPARYGAAEPNLGGGFIEFLFGGGNQGRAPRYQQAPAYQQAPGYGSVNTEPAGYPHYQGYQNEPLLQPAPQQQMYVHRGPAGAEPAQPTVDPRFLKQVVAYNGNEKPGTIIVDTPSKYLYLVQPDGKAVRYGIGVGRPGFTWSGVKTVSQKREWPDWRPPDEMLKRRPDLPTYMAGGPNNPLGARALYLGSSLYRIHGSNEPWTIGQSVSSGCIRMRNEDVIDLYERVKVGTKVVVI